MLSKRKQDKQEVYFKYLRNNSKNIVQGFKSEQQSEKQSKTTYPSVTQMGGGGALQPLGSTQNTQKQQNNKENQQSNARHPAAWQIHKNQERNDSENRHELIKGLDLEWNLEKKDMDKINKVYKQQDHRPEFLVGIENIFQDEDDETINGEGQKLDDNMRQSKLLESLDLDSAMWRGPVAFRKKINDTLPQVAQASAKMTNTEQIEQPPKKGKPPVPPTVKAQTVEVRQEIEEVIGFQDEQELQKAPTGNGGKLRSSRKLVKVDEQLRQKQEKENSGSRATQQLSQSVQEDAQQCEVTPIYEQRKGYSKQGQSKLKKRLRSNIETDKQLNQTGDRKRELSPGTACTRDDDLDVEEFIRDDLNSINKEERQLQEELIKLHFEKIQKVREIESKNNVQLHYQSSRQLSSRQTNDTSVQPIRDVQNEDVLEESIVRLDEMLIKQQIRASSAKSTQANANALPYLQAPFYYQQQFVQMAPVQAPQVVMFAQQYQAQQVVAETAKLPPRVAQSEGANNDRSRSTVERPAQNNASRVSQQQSAQLNSSQTHFPNSALQDQSSIRIGGGGKFAKKIKVYEKNLLINSQTPQEEEQVIPKTEEDVQSNIILEHANAVEHLEEQESVWDTQSLAQERNANSIAQGYAERQRLRREKHNATSLASNSRVTALRELVQEHAADDDGEGQIRIMEADKLRALLLD